MNYRFKKAVLRLVGIRLIECCENCNTYNHKTKTCISRATPWTNCYINSKFRKDWHCSVWSPGEGEK